MKNFSLQRNEQFGDYTLTPFYDLLNTYIHVPGESDMALDLFKDGYQTESYQAGSKYTKPDFIEFAQKLGIREKRFNIILDDMVSKSNEVEELVSRSFLDDSLKKGYITSYQNKLERIKY